MNGAAENRRKKLEKRKWLSHLIFCALGLAAVSGGVFSLKHYRDMASVSESLKGQQQVLRKTISQIGVTRMVLRR